MRATMLRICCATAATGRWKSSPPAAPSSACSRRRATRKARSRCSPGDVLIVFTDGVTEALNPADEEFGEDRLKEVLRAVVALPVEEMSAQIALELKNWIQDAAQYDDLTFVLMKVK